MTGPAALSTSDMLKSMYGLTPVTLGLDEGEYAWRVELWERQAATQAADPKDLPALIRVLALRAWQAQLVSLADKFRAEGDITVERDIMGRLALVGSWLGEAQGELPTVSARRRRANPSPEIEGWGLK
ncbi:hypothetical protein D3875_04050 [Deinococcus cavernae]|uniref:Uncharacterized protein n=1 Tax=Deinococcus cavernae TaxID=2320857 RepID=A0A418VED3_9DEIO|nr:hypothetical protein [Deinococcus cavernae]RJF74459.1 hypothetical protein D3875_04050 [Deinococcus cavernae]